MQVTFDEEGATGTTTQSNVSKLKTKHPGKQLHLQSRKQNDDDKYRVFFFLALHDRKTPARRSSVFV